MNTMHALPEPTPGAQVGAVLLTATAATRDEDGFTATVQAVNGHVLWSDVATLTTATGRADWARQAGPRTGLATDEMESGLLALVPLIDAALRGLPVLEWRPIVPLGAALPAMPFPVKSLLAPTLINFVNAVANAYRVPADFAAAGTLGTLSGAIGHRRVLHLGGELYASACLWIAAVGRSGSGKTPPIKRGVRPLRALQDAAIKRYQEKQKEYQSDLAEWEGGKPGARGPKPEAPTLPRVLISNITIESLASDLRHAPAGVLLVRDELAAWLAAFDKYSSGGGGSDRAAWLEIWSHETIDNSRKTGEDRLIYVPNPYAGVVGGIQPNRLHELIGTQDDGMGARVLLCYPDAPIAPLSDASIDHEVEAAYGALINTLWTAPYDEHAEPIRLSNEARRRYRERDADFKRQWPADVSARLDEALSKLCIYAGRLTNIVMTACEASGFDASDTDCVGAAWEMIGYFRHSAMRMHDGGGERHAQARRILAWIERGRREQFSLAELRDDMRRTLERGDDLDAPLGVLEEHHYIHLVPEPSRSGAGRKASPRYAVNPAIWRKNPKNTENSLLGANKSDKTYYSATIGQRERVTL